MDKFDAYIVGGNLGTGKTTTALRLQSKLGGTFVEPDLIRRELQLKEYRREDTARVMRTFDHRIAEGLHSSETLIISSPLLRKAGREALYCILNIIGATLRRDLQAVFIRCECSDELAKLRISMRERQDDDLHSPPSNPRAFERFRERDEIIQRDEMEVRPNISFVTLDTELNEVIYRARRDHHSDALAVMEAALLE